MFNCEMMEQVSSEIVLRDIDAVGMELLLDYAYIGQITNTADNVEVLLSASTLLQMQEVREACCQFLVKQLHPTNCLGIKSLADTLSCKELLEKSHCFIMENFQEVVSGKEFLLLQFNGVEELVSNSQLNISSEEVVYNAVLNWIKHDLMNRNQYIARLMVHVRLPLMKREFLTTTVENELLVREDSQCKEFLLEAFKYHLSIERRCALATPRTAERKPKGAEPYLFAIGGISSSEPLSECEVYNPRLDSWSTIAPMLSKCQRFGVTNLHRLLYAVGGNDGNSIVATAECYNPLLNTWMPIAPMGTPKYNLGICSFDGLIYACGGYDGNFGFTSMERFDPLAGVWYSSPAINTIRGYCRIAVVESCIYAIGGRDSENYSVERFDPRAGNWSPVPSMSSTRRYCDVAAINGDLYCVGGYDGTNRLSSGEHFDVRKNAWEPISSMHNLRWMHQVVAIDGCIYAIGGYTRPSSLDSVEKYDPKANKWSVVSSMVTARHWLGAAVLDCIDIEHVLRKTKNPNKK